MKAYFFGQANAIATILDFKSRGRLKGVESANKGVGVGIRLKEKRMEGELRFCNCNMVATIKMPAFQGEYSKTLLYFATMNFP